MRKIGARQAERRKIRALLAAGLALFCLLWGGIKAGAANTAKVEKLALTTSGTTIREGQEIELQISLGAYKILKMA